MTESDIDPSFPRLSKRALRRLIQRAFMLVGRDRNVRQHIREARLLTRWVLEDWKFSWTLELDRGRLYFERRPAKRADLVLTWASAEAFFHQIENDLPAMDSLEMEGNLELRKSLEPVFHAFRLALRGLLPNPVDDDGESLL